jgi:hypothetical protein
MTSTAPETEPTIDEGTKPDSETKASVPAQESPAAPPQFTHFAPLPPPPPGFVATRWSGPAYGGGPAAWLSALVGGVAAAVALPLTKPGIGWFLVGLVIAITVASAARYGPKPDEPIERYIRIGWVVLALALLAVGTYLNAYWLFYICVLGALGCASLAVAGGHSVRALIVAAVALPLSFFRSIPWLARGANAWQKGREKQSGTSRTVVAVLVTVVLLLVFGGLFASADPAFAKIVGDLLPELSGSTIRRAIFYTLIGGLFTAGAIFIVLAPPDLSGLERPSTRRIGKVELVLPLGGLVLLFAGFVAVQFRFLFSATAPEGTTFSRYAVQGFGQLVVVTLLTLLVIGCATRWAPKDNEEERTLLRGLLGALVLLSFVVVASAVYRMWLYMNELGWTRERLFFGAVELYLGFVFLLVIIAGIKLRATWFPRAIIASFAVLLIGIAAMNPERYIAERNIERFNAHKDDPSYMQTFDLGYLQFLTSDAIDELMTLEEPFRSCALKRIEQDLRTQPEQWYSWNYSRYHARIVIKQQQPRESACTEWFEIRDRTR